MTMRTDRESEYQADMKRRNDDMRSERIEWERPGGGRDQRELRHAANCRKLAATDDRMGGHPLPRLVFEGDKLIGLQDYTPYNEKREDMHFGEIEEPAYTIDA